MIRDGEATQYTWIQRPRGARWSAREQLLKRSDLGSGEKQRKRRGGGVCRAAMESWQGDWKMSRLMVCNDETDGGRDERDAHVKGHYSSAVPALVQTPPKGAASTTRLPRFLSPSSSVARFIPHSICASTVPAVARHSREIHSHHVLSDKRKFCPTGQDWTFPCSLFRIIKMFL